MAIIRFVARLVDNRDDSLRSDITAARRKSDWLLRVLAWFIAFLFLVYSLTSPAFRDAEGHPVGLICLPISIGLALFVFGWAVRFQRFAFWLGLALVSQAADLQLIEAGKLMRYQHYKPVLRLLAETHPLLLLFLLFQTILVCTYFLPRLKKTLLWLTRRFQWWQLVGVGLVFGLFSATVSPNVSRYLTELAFAAWIQLINLLNVILVVLAIPEKTLISWKRTLDRLFGQVFGEVPDERVRLDRYAVLAAGWVTILAALLSFFSYQRHPHIPDEVAYLYQARFFAQGDLALPAPRVPEAFDVYLMQFDGARWYPAPPPGWPAVLAIGEWLGAPWLVNPILAGFNTVLIYLLLGRMYSKNIARIALFLLCLSPWYVFMAMNFMTHTFTLTCALISSLGIIIARETGRSRWAWLAGGALGVMSLIRPLEGLVMAGLIGLWAIGVGGRRLKLFSVAALIAGTALVSALVVPYNLALTGKAMEFPINRYTDERFGHNSNAYGFGPDRGMGWPIDPNPGHSPIDGLINSDLNIFSINIELFGWGTGSLLLIALLALSGSYRKSDYLMAAVIAANFIFYFFYYFSGGPDFGARYWFLMIVPLVALAARGVGWLQEKAGDGNQASPGSTRVLVGVLILSGMTLINFFPWRAVDKYYHYLFMRPDITVLDRQYNFGKSLVLIRGDSHPDYASAFVYNSLDFNEDAPIYAWDRNPETRARLLAAYPGRPVWILDGPTVTKGAFEVVEGPILPASLLSRK